MNLLLPLILFITACSVFNNKSRRDLSSITNFNCDYHENMKIKLERPNYHVKCKWNDNSGRLIYLVRKHYDKKSWGTTLRIMNEQDGYEELIIEEETRTHIHRKGNKKFLAKYDPKKGSRLITELNSIVDDARANSIQWQVDPDQKVDKDRNLLSLVSHDGIDYFSFFYLPENFNKNLTYEVVVLFAGGTSSYMSEPFENWYMDLPTVKFLRKNNYIVLLSNFRGKKSVNNKFRYSGPGQMHHHSILDVVSALKKLSLRYSINKKKIKVIGHSRGGHMAALLATRLSEKTDEFKIDKTVVSSGVFNSVDGVYSFFKNEYPNGISVGEYSLDLRDDDWTNGALGYRPPNRFLDNEWKDIQEVMKRKYFKHFKTYYNEIPLDLFDTQSYFDQSPYHHAEGLQGKMLAFVSEVDKGDSGSTSKHGPIQFQEKVGKSLCEVIVHKWGHGFPPTGEGFLFWKETVLDFFNNKKSNYQINL